MSHARIEVVNSVNNMPKDTIIIVDDDVDTGRDTPEIRQKKIDWFNKIKREIGEVPNVDRDDPDFDLPGDDVGDK